MFDTSSEQPSSASSVIVVSNTNNYHTNGSDVINAAFTEAFGSVCDASYYFKNLIDFHQSHFHHYQKHHVFNLNVNLKSTSTDTSSEEVNPPLTNTTNLSQTAKKKRTASEIDTLKQNKIEDNLINLKLENSNLDENLNVKTNCSAAKRRKPCKFFIKKLIYKKYKKLNWSVKRVRCVRRVKRRFRFRRVRQTDEAALAVQTPSANTDTGSVATMATTDAYVSYQTGYYYSNDAEMTHTHFYEEQSTMYHREPARALNHDLLKLSYDKFKQFRLNEKLLQQTVLIRNAIKLLQYELQYQHEQEIQQQYLYQQQQQHHHHHHHHQHQQQQQHLLLQHHNLNNHHHSQQQQQQQQNHHQQQLLMDYNQSGYQHPLMAMNPSVYESVDDVMSRSVESNNLVQTTSYFVNDVNSAQGEEDNEHEENKHTDNTQTVNQLDPSSDNTYF